MVDGVKRTFLLCLVFNFVCARKRRIASNRKNHLSTECGVSSMPTEDDAQPEQIRRRESWTSLACPRRYCTGNLIYLRVLWLYFPDCAGAYQILYHPSRRLPGKSFRTDVSLLYDGCSSIFNPQPTLCWGSRAAAPFHMRNVDGDHLPHMILSLSIDI
ncbi:hypothetical protein MPTK1_6g03630 [Marchantia polymorpha subsp. ruderalis]|uniref:Secreted protein n=2 Tax=Marchantia polymorpha TaxID=3197 RepID=A0AAF6BN72_MARPO|nr:hypothetical protein MARPO_0035s0142 [Marchantia polymorpha]BBN13456.1 hypothetical protein Mp_6g03630 [Marchantia polymorpha subsp. ruderalis]|eukprot:PTQ41376.1 hypothetical protein MARPO_0035s0142 [Marchantia polymorpha]